MANGARDLFRPASPGRDRILQIFEMEKFVNDQDLIDSLSAKSPLERLDAYDTFTNILAVLTGVGIVMVTGLGLVFAGLYLCFGVG